MAIYTRTGDKGTTALFDGTRVLKSHIRVDAYGTIDELNSAIGVVIAHSRPGKIKTELEKMQHDLLEVGSALAFPAALPVDVIKNRPQEFEKMIDVLTKKMPELKNFILPGGTKPGALLHVARTICRRAERKVTELMQAEAIDTTIVIYLNRLSDLLFTMARFVNYKAQKKETRWIKK